MNNKEKHPSQSDRIDRAIKKIKDNGGVAELLKPDYYPIYTLTCDSCGYHKTEKGKYATNYFHEAGWRYKNKKILCPSCDKPHLNKKHLEKHFKLSKKEKSIQIKAMERGVDFFDAQLLEFMFVGIFRMYYNAKKTMDLFTPKSDKNEKG